MQNYGLAAHVADIDKDGFLDVLFSDWREYILIYHGSKNGYSNKNTSQIPCPVPNKLNTADLNGDGWLDLVVGHKSGRQGRSESFSVLYGGADGYRMKNSQTYCGGYSTSHTAVADFNRDGHLDLAASAYTSPSARVLGATVHYGNGTTLDMDNPIKLPAESSTSFVVIDYNRDGWTDLFVICHRDDITHQVDSLIYWNGPDGFAADRVTRLPGLGPHSSTPHDFGNGYTRRPEESYISPAFNLNGRIPVRIHWDGQAESPSRLKFKLRFAETKNKLEHAPWMGPDGDNSYYEESGSKINMGAGDAVWFQYRAVFVSPYGCRSPQLKEVRIELKE